MKHLELTLLPLKAELVLLFLLFPAKLFQTSKEHPSKVFFSFSTFSHIFLGVYKGAYVLSDAEKPQIILVGSGTETSIAVEAAAKLTDLRVRVVSMPSWELFREQSHEYQLSVFPDGVPVLAVEASSVIGWREYSHAVVGMSTFGDSGPYKEVYAKFGITTDNTVKRAKQVVEFYAKNPVGSIVNRP